jgi:hypothetical protein
LPGYRLLHEFLPLLSGLRNVARWGWLPLAAVAVLAGFGVATLDRRRWGRGVMIAIALLVTIEAIRTPVGFTRFNGIPQVYDRLASQSDVVVAEFPFYSGASVSLNGPYVLANTRYFKPLLVATTASIRLVRSARAGPWHLSSEAALAELRSSHIIFTVHTGRYGLTH